MTGICKCGHGRDWHSYNGICMTVGCDCSRYRLVVEPEEEAPEAQPSTPPCARCGHTLFQHSTGECEIHRCACEGYVATLSYVCVDPARRDEAWAVGSLPVGHRVRTVSSVPGSGMPEHHYGDDIFDDAMVVIAYMAMAVGGCAVGLFLGWLRWGLTW